MRRASLRLFLVLAAGVVCLAALVWIGSRSLLRTDVPPTAVAPPHAVPAFDPAILDRESDVSAWWQQHPYNPRSPAFIPVGGIAPAEPVLNVATQFNWDLQAAIDALPGSGGTLYLPAGIYATPSYNQIRGRGNIQLVGDPNGGTTVRQELDISGCANGDDCAYWKFNQCVYQADIARDSSAPCWQTFVNTPARNIYIKDITFDGGYAQRGASGRCSASWSDSIAVSLVATRDVLFDDVTFQNYCDPLHDNPDRDPATGLGQCAAACHPGLINFSGGNDNIWCRRCRFLGPGRYPWYSDGTRGSGMIDSYFQFKEPGEADPRLAGGPIFLNNDDFTMDENFDGSFQKSELRFPQFTVIENNTFSGYTDTQAIDYSGASAFIANNVVNDPEGRVIPSFVHLNVDCSYLWSASNGLRYQAYGNQIVGNRLDSGVNVFVRADAARGAVPQAGLECQVPGALGQYTVRDNQIARGEELNGQPFALVQDVGPVDGPNLVQGNCVAGQPADASPAACGPRPTEGPTPSP